MTILLWAATAIALLVSLLGSRKRTVAGLRMAGKRLWKLTPTFLLVMALYAVCFTAIPERLIQSTIGRDSGWQGLALATALGSVTMMPGFIAFPLCGALSMLGVPYGTLAAFSLALMNVGVVTFPLETRYFGWRVALLRNGFGLIVSLLGALVVMLAFGESF